MTYVAEPIPTTTAQPAPLPAPAPAPEQEGVLDRVMSAFKPADNGTTASSHRDLGKLATAALPMLAVAARRVPIGLLALGAIAGGVALANPKVRAKLSSLAGKGLDGVRR